MSDWNISFCHFHITFFLSVSVCIGLSFTTVDIDALVITAFFDYHIYVCIIGEFLTTEEAQRRQRLYDELASVGKLSPALLVIREHLPSGKACLRVNIDATKVGNVARFINHSCDGGNLQPVLVRSSGSLLPRLCFFAARDIMEGEELSFSYGDATLRPKGLPCFCGSLCCTGVLPSEET